MTTEGILIDPQVKEQEEEQEEETQEETQDESGLPEKYRGKSLEDVIEMHRNAEAQLGRRANEVGHYRSLIDDLITVKREKDLADNQSETDEEDLDISGDDLLRDPKSVLTSVIDRVLDKRIKPLEAAREQDSARTETQQFYDDFPDADAVAQDPKFHEWILKRPSRVADAKLASSKDGMDLNAARRLLENYKDFQEATSTSATGEEETEETQERDNDNNALTGVEGARKAATERSGDSSPGGKKLFYQSDVVDLMISNPEKYRSESYQSALTKAIKEGRFRK